MTIEKNAPENFNILQGKSVLLAEDDPINALVITELLSQYGANTDHALNGMFAVALSKEKQYDFILLDIHMPVMNGIEAATLIRSEESLNSMVPIFAVTADIMVNNDDDYLPLFHEFLFKPLGITQLQAAVEKATRKKI